MVKAPAIDTSPLIFLSKAGSIELLQILSAEIIVPQAVVTEIQAYGDEDITAKTLARTDWLITENVGNVPVIIQNWDLGPGESEVLTWGYNNGETMNLLDIGSLILKSAAFRTESRGGTLSQRLSRNFSQLGSAYLGGGRSALNCSRCLTSI